MNLKRHGASFTLVEMMVGIAVFSLLMLLLLAIMGAATKLWQQESAKEEGFREARSALNALSRDMRAALISTNTAWFYSNGTNQLAFLTTLPDIAQGTTVNNGDICAVGYSLEWGTNDSSGYQTNMSLYRYVSFSGPTYTNIINGSSLVTTVFNTNSATPPYVDGTNTVRELIARDVSQVSFVSYTNDVNGVPWACSDSTKPVTVLPNMVNVVVTTLNDKVAVQLTTQAQWTNANSPVIQQNEESFALRVRPQGP